MTPCHSQLSIIRQHAQIPLLAGPATLAHYKEWARSEPPAAVKAGYDKAQAVATARKDVEVAVAAGKPADMDLLASYMAYVKLEQVRGNGPAQKVISKDSGRVRCYIAQSVRQMLKFNVIKCSMRTSLADCLS